MNSLSASAVAPALPHAPVQSQAGRASGSKPCATAQRIDRLRRLLLQHDVEMRPQYSSCSGQPVLLGQWRN
jgi:hypothetical protein